MDYSKTLNLPRTQFSMRANLPQKELEILQFWQRENIYQTLSNKRKGNKKFILHDGPPYANEDIHLGQALNKILKDIINKSKAMQGYDIPFIPGWDTHGLPTEQEVIKKHKIKYEDVSIVEWRKRCKEFALKYVDRQKEQFKRLGIIADWDNPYITLDKNYELYQIKAFFEIAKRGYLYRALKPIYWCTSCKTALAEAEIEYHTKTSPSIYLKFKVKDSDDDYFLVWTTTPWTLIGNVAITLHPEINYQKVKTSHGNLILAETLIKQVFDKLNIKDYEIKETYKGNELENKICYHPLLDRESVVVLDVYVRADEGTGCVHTAPGHGYEDYLTSLKYNLPIISPVDENGCFTEDADKFANLDIEVANKEIIKELQLKNLLLDEDVTTHQYPHCWRCKNPIIFRATQQWFIDVNKFRKEVLQEIDKVKWIPPQSINRIRSMVEVRPDWCLSRQRVWGVPIPVFYCKGCNKEIIEEKIIELFEKETSDAWYEKDVNELLGKDFHCPNCASKEFDKEKDIMDVWFDSGCSHFAVLDTHPQLTSPCDLYLEGSDQHRGWFQTSLLTSVMLKKKAPYKEVLTHGFLVDEKGMKVSKSLGNIIPPEEIIKNYGAEIIRLWVTSVDFRTDMQISTKILEQVVTSYRKIRNTLRFLISNLYDFNYKIDKVEYDELEELDKWILYKLNRLIEKVIDGYNNYEFHFIYKSIYNFCVIDLSAIYIDILKDRLYVEGAKSKTRRAAQTTLFELLLSLTKLIYPILSFTAEEVYQSIPNYEEKEKSITYCLFPDINKKYENKKLKEKWDKIIAIKEEVNKAIEKAKTENIIAYPLQSKLIIYLDKELYTLVEDVSEKLKDVFIVSGVDIVKDELIPEEAYLSDKIEGLGIKVERHPGKKCPRCWQYTYDEEEICKRCKKIISEYE